MLAFPERPSLQLLEQPAYSAHLIWDDLSTQAVSSTGPLAKKRRIDQNQDFTPQNDQSFSNNQVLEANDETFSNNQVLGSTPYFRRECNVAMHPEHTEAEHVAFFTGNPRIRIRRREFNFREREFDGATARSAPSDSTPEPLTVESLKWNVAR